MPMIAKPTGRRTPKYRQLRDHLLARIQSGEFPVHAKLPTITETSARFGASYVTTRRAYCLLAEEGILKLTKGPTGTRVIRTSLSRPARQLTVAGLFRPARERNRSDNFAIDMFESVCHALAEAHAGIIHHRLNTPDAVETVLERVKKRTVDGLVLDQLVPDEMVRRVGETGHPAVIYNRHPEQPAIDSVCHDMEWLGRETARRAMAAGYRRIVFCLMWSPELHADPEGRTRIYTNETYMNGALAALHHGGFPEAQTIVTYEPLPTDAERWAETAFFCNHLRIPARPDGVRTLYFALSDFLALRIHETLLARGFRVPDDAGVIGLFDFECNRSAAHPVTTWHIDPVEIGRVAVETLIERIEFPERERVQRHLKPSFVDHGTL